MESGAEEWDGKGATLSDKTARSEYGLTQDEIYAAIGAGKLQYRPAAMHGNPWLRLLRREVEDLLASRSGDRYLQERKARTELARINRELKQLRGQIAALEEMRAVLLAELDGKGNPGRDRQACVRHNAELLAARWRRKLAAVLIPSLIDPERPMVPRSAFALCREFRATIPSRRTLRNRAYR